MYVIKASPEDFIVKEVYNLNLKGTGQYSYYLLKKRDYTTLKAIELIAKAARLPLKYIGFAGNKDKKAITEQLISIKTKRIFRFSSRDIALSFLGFHDEPVYLGSHEGNYFTITLRNLSKSDIAGLKRLQNKNRVLVPNFFGEQRFSRKNSEIGKALVKKDFRKACSLIGIDVKGKDYIGALTKVNKKLLQLFVHAYQSGLFNETLEQYLKLSKMPRVKMLPVLGFGTELKGIAAAIVKRIMRKEMLNQRDFIVRELPFLSSEGTQREPFMELKQLKIAIKDSTAIVSFFLKKGCYATTAIEELMHRVC